MAEQLTTFEATVAKTSETGFKVNEREKWLTWSKFAPDKITPPVGARVQVTLDGREFIRHVEITEAPRPAPIAEPAQAEPSEPIALPLRIQQDDRGTVITRMNVLSTATAILSSGGRETDAETVIELAARLETWVTR